MKLLIFSLLLIGIPAFASQQSPSCKAQMFDLANSPIAKLNWEQPVFIGVIEGDGFGIRISTSLGYDQIMSLWIREKRTPHPNGAFAFVDLSSGREQKNALYLANGYHVEVTCQWKEK